MSDEFGTRPGGGRGDATEGGYGDDPPADSPTEGYGEAVADEEGFDGAAGGDLFDEDDDRFGDDGPFDDDADARAAQAEEDFEDERSSPLPGGAPARASVPSWVGVVTAAGLGLVTIQALVVLGTVAQALAVERFRGDVFHKVGVATLSNIRTEHGLVVVVAAILVALPMLLGVAQAEVHRRRQAIVFGVGAMVALMIVAAMPLAVRARLFVIDAGGQTADALARRVIATYVAGTLGSALVALGTCLGLSRYSRTVSPPP